MLSPGEPDFVVADSVARRRWTKGAIWQRGRPSRIHGLPSPNDMTKESAIIDPNASSLADSYLMMFRDPIFCTWLATVSLDAYRAWLGWVALPRL
jgi:hypothetical protein